MLCSIVYERFTKAGNENIARLFVCKGSFFEGAVQKLPFKISNQ
jgi:hypothetical protein